MSLQVTAIMLGVADLGTARKFYVDGLGCAIDKNYPGFVSLNLGPDSSSLALYERAAAAADAGVPAEGSGFTGISFHYVVASRDEVDAIMNGAETAGGAIVRPAATSEWAGYFGYFSDPDGYLWKVATSA